jgi:DNA-binding winged helix-turn-helix (wHTH) protein/tetratricopeptide (TPR) repeat protein
MGQQYFGLDPVRELEETPSWPAAHNVMFDTFRLNRRDERLWRGQEVVPLHPKTFAVLCCLVQQAGQLVTKDTLLEAVWPETSVSDSVLQVAIRQLRQVLGDQARTPRFIETVYGRGYRFIAPVRAPGAPGEPVVLGVRRAAPAPRFRRPRHFVGRTAALTQMLQWWTTAQQGTRQVGVIAGEPGIGKTALVEAFLAQMGAAGDCRVGHGQCIEPYGPGEPYLPVLEAFGRLCREPDGSRLVSVLRQYAPSWLVQMPALLPPAEWEALQRAVGHAVQPRMLRELTEALDVLTTERPLVLILEDLHWSDHATLEWLAYVARRPDPARLLILGTYRPVDVNVSAHPLRTVLTELQQHGQCVQLALDYLSEVEVMAYLRQRFGNLGLAADLARVLHQRTYGNPLFLIAVVDEIVRQQVVREGPEGWTLQKGVETIPTIVPATLLALIEHQLAHCSPEAQTLLEAASVAGVEFTAAAVAAGLECTDAETEAQCVMLAHHEQFLQARGRAEWPDGTVTACFGFRHALYQDVLYQRIPAGRQTRWHARIGARLEQGFGVQAGDLAAALALHFLRGHRLPQAVQYLQQAGEKAIARSAHREAVGYFEQALRVLPQLPATRDTCAQAIDLRLTLRSALRVLGDFARLLAVLDEAEALAVALNDPRRQGQVALFMSQHYRMLGLHVEATAAAQRTLALATASGDGILQALTNQYLGISYHVQGDYRRAIDCFAQTIMSLDGAHRHERFSHIIVPAVNSRAWSAVSHAELGWFTAGRILGDEGLQIAEAIAHPDSLLNALRGVGLLALRQGNVSRALQVLERAMGIGREAAVSNTLHNSGPGLGATYILAGRVADAVSLLTQALDQILAQDMGENLVFCRLSLGEAHLLVGHLEEANALAEQARAFAYAHQERGNQAYALRLLGEIAAHRNSSESNKAEDYYCQALALAQELGMRPLQAHCHRGLGILSANIGQAERARSELATAIAMYQSMGMTFWLPPECGQGPRPIT